MNIVIFDTETTSLNKPFCYNVGYVIAADNGEILLKREYVIEQVWHNLPLFESAYYKEKRSLYVSDMRAKKILLRKWGYVCQQMSRDFIKYNVEKAFAYNSPFDDNVFTFNCDWFKCKNPFDTIPIIDIRGFAHNFIVDNCYKNFCDKYQLYTDTGNYSTTAENIYRYITKDTNFLEAHTALNDSEIETEILFYTIKLGADLNKDYQVQRTIPKVQIKTLQIYFDGEQCFEKDYTSIRISSDKTKIKLK